MTRQSGFRAGGFRVCSLGPGAWLDIPTLDTYRCVTVGELLALSVLQSLHGDRAGIILKWGSHLPVLIGHSEA